MNPTYFIPILVLFIIIFIIRREEEMAMVMLIKKKFSKEAGQMKELAQRFIGKECII